MEEASNVEPVAAAFCADLFSILNQTVAQMQHSGIYLYLNNKLECLEPCDFACYIISHN